MSGPALLMYHWFRPAGAPSASRSPQLEIEPRAFERQIGWLARRGYRSLTVRDWIRSGAAARRTVVLTFDDGTEDFREHALPVLRRHGFTATLFVVTAYAGGRSEWDRDLGEPSRPLLSWDRIRELHAEGFEIGSHTHTHRVLTALDDASAAEEMTRSREALADALGAPPYSLAYPRGFFEARHRSMARDAGYGAACAVTLRWRDLRDSERYGLRRMTIKGNESFGGFRLRLALGGRVRHRVA